MHFAVKQVVKAVGRSSDGLQFMFEGSGRIKEKKKRTQTPPELKVTHSCSGNKGQSVH